MDTTEEIPEVRELWNIGKGDKCKTGAHTNTHTGFITIGKKHRDAIDGRISWGNVM